MEYIVFISVFLKEIGFFPVLELHYTRDYPIVSEL